MKEREASVESERVSAVTAMGSYRGKGVSPVVLPVGMWGKVGFFMMGCLLVSSVMMGLVASVMWWGQESVWARVLGWVAVVCWILVVVNVVWLSSERWREWKAGERG
jgi:hypothetical protein